MNRLFEIIVSAGANLLVPVVRVMSFVGFPLIRFGRLTKMRACVCGSVPVCTQFDGAIHVVARANVTIGKASRLGRDVQFETVGGGAIQIGRHCRLSAGVCIVSYASIVIGDDCLIGEYVSIRDANHGTAAMHLFREQRHESAAIRIGHNVWIGRGTVVLKGVTIGAGSVVGANSVVTRDIPPGCIAVGVPAKVIKRIDGAASVADR